jgi:ribonuclease HI
MEAKRSKKRIGAIWIFAKKGEDADAVFVFQNGIKISKKIGKATKTQADYKAMHEAMDMAAKEKGKMILYTESALIVGQLYKKWKIKANKDLARKTKKKFNGLKDKLEIRLIDEKYNMARE